jgi:hypothetical protein
MLSCTLNIPDRTMWTGVTCVDIWLSGGTCEQFSERSDIVRQQITSSCRELLCSMKSDTYLITYLLTCGPGSSVGIATGYGLDGPGIEFRWG